MSQFHDGYEQELSRRCAIFVVDARYATRRFFRSIDTAAHKIVVRSGYHPRHVTHGFGFSVPVLTEAAAIV